MEEGRRNASASHGGRPSEDIGACARRGSLGMILCKLRLLGAHAISQTYKRLVLLDVLGVVVGVLGGLGAVLFRMMIYGNHTLFFGFLYSSLRPFFRIPYAIIPLLPALGGLVVGIITTRLAPETRGHGVPEVMKAVIFKGGLIRKRVALLRIIASSLTIGSGGSAGRVGPIAQVGAAFGSLIGQVFKLQPRELRLLVISGLAAGIAATFNAPLGGALFGMELFVRKFEISNVEPIPIILAAVVGAAVASTLLGAQPEIEVAGLGLTFANPAELIFYFILGLIFGVLAVVWVKTFYAVEDAFSRLRVPDVYKPAIGGLCVGLLGLLFPTYGVMGVGYGMPPGTIPGTGIDLALAGKLSFEMLLVLGIAKILATSLTIGSGGSGGLFSPTFYIGAMFGGALSLLFHQLFPSIVHQPYTYALVGMGALFAGAAQTPLTVMILIPEMANDYALLPPLMVSASTSFFIARLFLKGSSIYIHFETREEGVRIKMGRMLALEAIRVRDIMRRGMAKL